MSALDDPRRLAALTRTGLLDSPPEASFDRLTKLASAALGVPVVLVSLVDDHRQFFKSQYGLESPWREQRGTPLTHSFCKHVVQSAVKLIVNDAKQHPVVRDNLAIPELGVAAYAGIPLSVDGQEIGAFCAIDAMPRAWTDSEIEILTAIAQLVMAEIQLRASLRMQTALFDSAPVAIGVADLDGVVVRTNEAYDRLLGYGPGELVGKRVDELMPEDDREQERQILARRAFVAGTAREKRYRRKDGSVFWGRVRNGVVLDGEGAPTLLTGMVVDISEHRRVSEALEAREAQYKAIVSNMPNSAVLMLDGDLRFVAAGGPLLTRILQTVQVSDIVGYSVHELVTEQSRATMVPFYRAIVDGTELQIEVRRLDRSYEVRGVPLPSVGTEKRALVFFYDVSEREHEEARLREAHDALANERRLFATTLDHMHDGVVLIDKDHQVLLANDAFHELLDLPPRSMIGKNGRDLIDHLRPRVDDEEILGQFLAQGELEQEITLVKPRRRVLQRRITPLQDNEASFLIVWRDVTAAFDLAVEREHQVYTDQLTGIGNRRAAERAMDVELSRKSRMGSRMSIALFDIDHFKRINDSHGHAAGDEVLRRVAATLEREGRKTDIIARWGGEEFVAVLPVGIAGAQIFCERARAAVGDMVSAVGRITISVGIAEVVDGESLDATIDRADKRLYEAKRAGRDRVVA